MTKKELINSLSELDDNDEVFLWNGLVNDYQDFHPEIVEMQLARRTKENYRRDCVLDYCQGNDKYNLSDEDNKKIDKIVEQFDPDAEEYKLANPYLSEESLNKYYSDQKTIYVFNTVSRNKEYCDRCCSIKY